MDKPKRYVSLVLDKSASMAAWQQQMVSGYNEFIADLKDNTEDDIRCSLTLFDTVSGIRYHGQAIRNVETLKFEEYLPDGFTALYDAVAQSIHQVEADLREMSEKPAVVMVIMTDGQENSSREYNQAKIKDLIETKTKEGNWTFVYLGANQDAWLNSAAMGIPAGNTQSYSVQNTAGTVSGQSVSYHSNSRRMRSAGAQSTQTWFDPTTDAPAAANSGITGKNPWESTKS